MSIPSLNYKHYQIKITQHNNPRADRWYFIIIFIQQDIIYNTDIDKVIEHFKVYTPTQRRKEL